MLLVHAETVDNQTLCDLFEVANTGGIRVSHRRNHIVLVSNNTDPTYRNEWQGDALHFVGRGSVGPQMLARQNKTLANASRRNYRLYLFEVFDLGKYVYAGEVELAGDPYLSEQPDAEATDRFVWMFPLRRKQGAAEQRPQPSVARTEYLPHGAYAVISDELTDEQRALVDAALDKLKEAGVPVFDQRDRDERRYERQLARWWEAVLHRVRAKIKELIASRKRAARAAGREFKLVDDELRVNSASTEAELRAALVLLDYDDPVSQQEIFDEAIASVPMPKPPTSVSDAKSGDLEKLRGVAARDRSRFADFT